MIYKEENKNLFSVSDDYYLVQCISADFAMGAGIAVQFNQLFNTKNNLKRKYGNDIINEWNIASSKGFCLQDGRVFNLITKCRYFQKPNITTIRNSLYAFKNKVLEQKIKLIAMPRIGSGLDKMKWTYVREALIEIFDDTDITILVCYQ